MSEQSHNEGNEGIVTRDHSPDDAVEPACANLNESIRAYQEVSNVAEMDAPAKEYGTQDEVTKALETLERTFRHSLEELTEADIQQGVEQGDLTEANAAFALRHKRQLELAKAREGYTKEASREHDGDERE